MSVDKENDNLIEIYVKYEGLKGKTVIDRKTGLNKTIKPTFFQILKEKGVDVNSQCLDGFCGACKCKKPKEDVLQIKDEKKEIDIMGYYDEETEVLSCVSQIDITKVKPDENGMVKLTFNADEIALKNKKNVLSEQDKLKAFVKQKTSTDTKTNIIKRGM